LGKCWEIGHANTNVIKNLLEELKGMAWYHVVFIPGIVVGIVEVRGQDFQKEEYIAVSNDMLPCQHRWDILKIGPVVAGSLDAQQHREKVQEARVTLKQTELETTISEDYSYLANES
jgi:hypothetical protein